MRTRLLLILLSLHGANLLSAAEKPAAETTPDVALANLQAGNERFASSVTSGAKPTRDRRLATAQGQHPFAIIVGCSDSRTPPEIIFDQNIGDLFVVRTAGNLADDYALGSIEYAAEHLGARLIVVLGHARCGAVAAAVESPTAPGHVGLIVNEIRPAVEAAQTEPGDRLVDSIKKNVDRVAKRIEDKSQLGALASSIRVVEAYYDLDSGKVTWMKKTTSNGNQ